MGTVMQDLKFSLRTLARKPGFAAVVIFTLALGIGANSTIFSMVNGLLLRGVPYEEPETLVRLFGVNRQRGVFRGHLALPEIAALREQTTAFAEVAALTLRDFNLTGGEKPVRVQGAAVSANHFALIGQRPSLGRTFTADEDRPGGPRVVLLSNRLWQRDFGGAPNILGRVLQLDDESYEVIGVLPAEASYPYTADVFMPLAREAALAPMEERYFAALARLRDGDNLKRARQELWTLSQRLAEEHPASNRDQEIWALPLAEDLFGEARSVVMTLWVVALLLLLLVCANVANLLLQRTLGRHREFSLRQALGASRGRILRQVLTENLVLAFSGAIFGLLLALWLLKLIASALDDLPPFLRFDVDARVFAFTLVIAGLSALLAGLIPAWRSARTNLREALGDGSSNATTSASRQRLRHTLMVSQITLSLVPLIVACLVVKGVQLLRDTHPGFDKQNLLTLQVTLPSARYPTHDERSRFFDRLDDGLAAQTGVSSASVCWTQPFTVIRYADLSREGRVNDPGAAVGLQLVGDTYLETLRLPLLKGRGLSRQDDAESPRVALISSRLEERLWGEGEALGQRFKLSRTGEELFTVVGVVADTLFQDAADADAGIDVFLPARQVSDASMSLVARTVGDPHEQIPAVKRAIAELDPDLPPFAIATAAELFDRATASPRLISQLFALFALAALGLALVGVYGTVAYTVAQRQREIGIRLALGARPREILSLVIGRLLGLLAVGAALGLLGALALNRTVASLLEGIETLDPVIYLAAPVVLMLVALLAGYLAVRPGMRVDPASTLRAE